MLRHFLITHLGKISLHVKNLQNYKSTFLEYYLDFHAKSKYQFLIGLI